MLDMFWMILVELERLKLNILLFFFSSRRRHTRCLSDWSSDVCSSDLGVLPGRRRLDEGRGAAQHAVPDLAHHVPERLARAGEGAGRLALRVRQPDRPILADLARQRRPHAVTVDGLDVFLALEPALPVQDDARGPVE